MWLLLVADAIIAVIGAIAFVTAHEHWGWVATITYLTMVVTSMLAPAVIRSARASDAPAPDPRPSQVLFVIALGSIGMWVAAAFAAGYWLTDAPFARVALFAVPAGLAIAAGHVGFAWHRGRDHAT